MPQLEQTWKHHWGPALPPAEPAIGRPLPGVEIDERAARRALRTQIARLERALSQAITASFPRPMPALAADGPLSVSSGGPRLLALGELELERDRLAVRLNEVRQRVSDLAETHEHNRRLLERMFLEPGRYKFVRLANADLGEGGCGVWQVRPRLGLIGMLAGWWQVKLSSGCPLAG